MLVKHVEEFSIIKAHFIQVTKNLGCGESFSIIEKLNIINTGKRAKKVPPIRPEY